ncbi:MAG: hypothetical protein PHW18_05750 [Sulfuricurvum sp.]|uniref:hypothetical protein n=1 Tax=Sulfuricurvum sp. TaxID=2025608 RepID=UPI002632B238|nr:hypothetical protein [Sulfuricurvum sp.]MDD2829061.1 hypothetical protein [Sulfuricurvum sp.]MDD4949708.1 hypothetical protein [Sulfuricurvum sp.]
MNLKSAKILTTLILASVFFIGCGGGGGGTATPASTDTTTPVFSSVTVADDLLDGNFTTSTVVYDATADNDINVTYTLASGVGSNDLFNIASDGNVTFKALPTVSGAHNDYNLTIRATDTAHNHTDQNVTLRVINDVINLGTYGLLIAPVHVGGKWFYHWDLSGDGTSADAGSLNGGVDVTNHDVLDALFNHDINGTVNTTVANYDGAYGTTNDYRYATINGVQVALPTTGTGLANETSGYSLSDNGAYTDLTAIWDAFNGGYIASGTPTGWPGSNYWSATPSTYGHGVVDLIYAMVFGLSDNNSRYVVLQVL